MESQKANRPRAIAMIVDDESSTISVEIEFDRITGDVGTIVVPRADYAKPNEVGRKLLSAGAEMPNVSAAHLVKALIDDKPEVVRYMVGAGLVPASDAYVAGDSIVGSEGDYVVQPELNQSSEVRIRRSGTLEEWQQKVAKLAIYSTAAVVVICLAFAAILLRLLGMHPFVVIVFGPSKIGKTLLQLLAGCVFSRTYEDDLLSWSSTQSFRLEQAVLFSGRPLLIDEVATIGKNDAGVCKTIQEFAFGLATGRDRGRHSSWSNRERSSISVIAILSSVRSLTEHAELAGISLDEGERARIIELPAISHGAQTIFDWRPSQVPDEDAEAWAKSRLAKLRAGVLACHGTAFEPYVKNLLRDADKTKERAEHHMKAFLNRSNRPRGGQAFEHAMRSYALAYAAGMLAIEWGVLPWSAKNLRIRMVRGAKSILDSEREVASVGERALQLLRENLASKSVRLKKEGSSFSPVETPAFRQRTPTGLQFTVTSREFRSWFPSRGELDAVLSHLRKTNLLLGGSASKGTAIGRATTTPRWPNGINSKAIRFADPWPEDRKARRE